MSGGSLPRGARRRVRPERLFGPAFCIYGESAAGATPVGVAITMDRQERAKDDPANRRSGVQYVEQELGLRVVSIATLADLMAFLQTTGDTALAANLERVEAYRARYGIDA